MEEIGHMDASSDFLGAIRGVVRRDRLLGDDSMRPACDDFVAWRQCSAYKHAATIGVQNFDVSLYRDQLIDRVLLLGYKYRP